MNVRPGVLVDKHRLKCSYSLRRISTRIGCCSKSELFTNVVAGNTIMRFLIEINLYRQRGIDNVFF